MKELKPTSQLWFDPHSDVISLVRLGSHSELFD